MHKDVFRGEYFLDFKQDIESLLKKIELGKQKNYYFYMRNLESASGPHVKINGREMINLASNNYLGLTFHPKVKEAAIDAIRKYGVGSGGVRLLSGTYKLHEQLEEKIAEFKGTESAVVFSTGFMTNAGIIPVLAKENTALINDNKNHASIIDGCKASSGKIRIFKHNNMERLEKILQSYNKEQNKLIIVDSVFSMDGDLANLPEIYKLAQRYNARIMIDEAHATGVIGQTGRGAPEHFNLIGKIDIVMGTLSKALGTLGGFIATSKKLATYLKHVTREFIFSSSLPPPIVTGTMAAIEVIREEPNLLKQLWQNIKVMKKELSAMGYDTGISESAIIPLLIRNEVKTYKITQLLDEAGIFVNPITFPAVKKVDSRLRVSIMALLDKQDLEKSLNAFKTVGKKLDII